MSKSQRNRLEMKWGKSKKSSNVPDQSQYVEQKLPRENRNRRPLERYGDLIPLTQLKKKKP